MGFIDHPRCIAVIAVTLLTCSAVTARNVAARPKDDPLVEQLNSINGVHVREGDEIRVSALWAEYGRIPGPALDVELDGSELSPDELAKVVSQIRRLRNVYRVRMKRVYVVDSLIADLEHLPELAALFFWLFRRISG